jgi:Tfp pilus assembly protein PilF
MTQSLLESAIHAYEAGDHELSAQLCSAALQAVPDDEAFLTLLAVTLQSCGRFDGAIDAFRKLTVLRPEVAEYWSNLGLMLRHQKNFPAAEEMFRHAITLPHHVPDILVNYGLLLLDMGRPAEARMQFLDACELEGHSADARIHAALTCIQCGDIPRAETLIPPAITWAALEPELRLELTKALIHLGRVAEAESRFQPQADQGDPLAIARMASLYERTNRLEQSRLLLDRIRQYEDPDVQLDVLTLDATLAIRGKDYPRARASTSALLQAADVPVQARISAHFMMAAVADKQGLVTEAMGQLGNAHGLQFKLASEMEPEIAASADEPLRIGSKWLQPENSCFQGSVDDPATEESPVFIVGFPRSGTTMLEQMLDAHPAYVSMDERIIVQDCVKHMESMGFAYPDQLDHLQSTHLVELRALYWSQAAKVTQRNIGQTLVDKNPLNILRLPMIRRLFPSARIILALRHPCDVILSCYMQNFRSPAFMILCSTLERLAKNYANTMNFWIHHQALLTPDSLILRYEDTVTNFPGQVENIANFLGIQDRHPLERFAEHAAAKGYISTPSYSQVIKPVNRSALARWLPYRAYFEPLFPILRPVAEHWGYALPET